MNDGIILSHQQVSTNGVLINCYALGRFLLLRALGELFILLLFTFVYFRNGSVPTAICEVGDEAKNALKNLIAMA